MPLHAIGADAQKGDRAIHEALQRRGVRLSATEDAVMAAAWRAGRITTALRTRAEQRRQRAEFARAIWAGLRYPLVLFLLIVVASFATAAVVGHYWFAIGVLGGAVACGALAVVVRRGLLTGGDRWARLPIVGRMAANLGELPYLETLHSLYAAGVPLVQAHAAAVAAVPIQVLRRRLLIADRELQGGRNLTEALAHALALHAETRTLLATGEHAGQLEDALLRALTRRRETSAREVGQAAKRLGHAAYAVATLVVVAIVFSFYANYAGMLRQLRR